MTTLWIRTEGSRPIGLGHIFRQSALAQQARFRGHDVVFVIDSDEEAIRSIPRRWGFHVEDAGEIDGPWLRKVHRGDVVILDGPGVLGNLDQLLLPAGVRIGAVDDTGTGAFDVDVLVNPNGDSDLAYRLPNRAYLLAGPSFAFVREEFLPFRRQRSGSSSHLLLTFGGSDPSYLGRKVVAILDRHRPFERVTMVVGPASGILIEAPEWLRIVQDPKDIPSLFDTADAVMSAAGSTTWELMAMGIPAGVIQMNARQHLVVETLQKFGCGLVCDGDTNDAIVKVIDLLADSALRERLSRQALEVVDGLGTRRVCNALLP